MAKQDALANDLAYGASDITVLEGLEAVRKRPGMYIGSTGERGLHHLVYEVVDNSVDEALAGYCDHIEVTLLADGGVRVVDNGRGIPVGIVASEGKSAVEVVLTVLHAGGKFGGDGYKVSGGLHGVGVSVVNALSERLVIEVDRDGNHHRQEYAKGGKPQGKMAIVGDTPSRGRTTGTTITFWPDPTIFAAEGTEFVARTVLERLQTMAFLNKGLSLTLTDERPEHIAGESDDEEAPTSRAVTYKYDGGLVDYVTHLNAAKKAELVHPEVISIETEDVENRISVELALQWTNAYSESVFTYANTIATTEGGTHEEGFRAAMTGLTGAPRCSNASFISVT